MSQTWDIDLISPTGTSPSADIQRIIDGLDTLRSTWSGATEPAVGDRVAYMYWADTTTGTLKIRDAANAAWIVVGTLGSKYYGNLCNSSVTKSANYTVVATDRGVLLSCTGTFTLTFTAAATLGDGFTSVVRNDGAGVITLDANSAELIDGQLTITLQTGETALVYCDGAALKTFNRLPVGAQQENPIINGNMDIWQRGTSFAAVASNTYTADRWKWGHVGTGVVTVSRSTTVPTVAQAGVLFNYALQVNVTTADASLAATDQYHISTPIEGYNWRQFAQRALVISFWVRSSKTGEHAVALLNTGIDRTYVGTYTINAADTYEWKTVTVLASPSAGTWDYTNGLGVVVRFALASGSNFHTTAGAWQTGAFLSTAAQVNVMDTVGNNFFVIGVKMQPGSVATPIQFTPFEVALAACRRYYQKSFPYTTTPVQNVGSTSGAALWVSPVTATGAIGNFVLAGHDHALMRVSSPAVTTYNPSAANANPRNATDAADDSAPIYTNGGTVLFTVNPANTAGDTHHLHWAADAEL